MSERPSAFPPLREFYGWALGSIFLIVFSAASAIAAVVLFTFCIPISYGPGTTVCVVPHSLAAIGMAFLSMLLFTAGVYTSYQALVSLRPAPAEGPTAGGRPTASFAPVGPRRPDTPVPGSWFERLGRGLGSRSWIDDAPPLAPTSSSPTDPPVRARPPP